MGGDLDIQYFLISTEYYNTHTQKFLCKCGELLDGKSSLGCGWKLPADHLSHLIPCSYWRFGEEIHILWRQRGRILSNLYKLLW